MIPRLRGKVGQATEPEDMKGKWFFEIWLTTLGGGEGESMGCFGPFKSEKEAQDELVTCVRLMSDKIAEQMGGESGKFVNMKTNQIEEWPELPKEKKGTNKKKIQRWKTK